jgi:hypothetical protein
MKPALMKPLFIPLYTKWFEKFADGSKTVEYRTYGPRWNERTCQIGRAAVLSKGYGKYARLNATVVRFVRRGKTAAIHLNVELP